MSESDTHRFGHCEGIIAQEAHGQTVLLRLSDGSYYTLEGVGASVWELCDGNKTFEEIVGGVCTDFDATPDVVRGDVREFLADLVAERLLEEIANRWRALGRLRGRRELWLFIRVLTVAPFFPLLLRLPLPIVDRIFSSRRRPARCGLEPQRVAAVIQAAQSFAHPVVRRGCLTRGLSLYWLLAQPSAGLRLCFGLGGPADGFAGHCWIERDGEPYLEKDDPRQRFPEQFAIPMRSPSGDLGRVSFLG